MTEDQYIVAGISATWTVICVGLGWLLMKYGK